MNVFSLYEFTGVTRSGCSTGSAVKAKVLIHFAKGRALKAACTSTGNASYVVGISL